MKYNALQSIGLFKLYRQNDPDPPTKDKNPLLPPQYTDAEACQPTPLFVPEGSNVYFGWKDYTQRFTPPETGSIFNDLHTSMISAVRNLGGVLNFGLQPDSGANAHECHQAVINDPNRLDALFDALQRELDPGNPGFKIVVRYAGEMNQPDADNIYAGSPADYIAAIKKVIESRDRAGLGVLLAFSPAINAAVGVLRPTKGSPGKITSIADYWPNTDGLEILSCTLYCRPQNGNYSDDDQTVAVARDQALNLVMGRANAYFTSGFATGRSLMLDEIGGSMRPQVQTDPEKGEAPMPPMNDKMLQMMLNRLLPDPTTENGYGRIEYGTLFLVVVWGRDAALKFIKDVNPTG